MNVANFYPAFLRIDVILCLSVPFKCSVARLTINGGQMIAEQSDAQSWEEKKFLKEMELRERELVVAELRLKSDNRRNLLIGALVPIIVALMTILPSYLNSKNQQAMQRATFEANLIMESIKTGDPDQAAENLKFLTQSGLLTGQTASQIEDFLVSRRPGSGVGRALPK